MTGYDPCTSESAWSLSGIKLGFAVNSVVNHLQLNPPRVIEITDESLKRIQNTIAQQQSGGSLKNGSAGENAHFSFSASVNEPPPSYNTVLSEDDRAETEMFDIPIPSIPPSFPELDSMSRNEVQELLDDEGKFHLFVESMSALATLVDLKDSIFKGNVETAGANLKHEEELGALCAEVTTLQESLQEKIATFRELEKMQNDLFSPPDKQKVIKRLTAAKKEAFDESEELASSWIDNGEMDIDDFVLRFLEKRTIHHVRAVKIERLNEQM